MKKPYFPEKFIIDATKPIELHNDRTGEDHTMGRYTVFEDMEDPDPLESSNDLEYLQQKYGLGKRLPVYREPPKSK